MISKGDPDMPPRRRRPPAPVQLLSDQDFADLKDLATEVLTGPDGQMTEALLHCLGEEGLRIKEAFELGWWDIDIDCDILTVAPRIPTGGPVPSPVHPGRRIRLFPGTKERLLALPPHESTRVFVDSVGRPFVPSRFHYRWRRVAQAWQRSRDDDHWIHTRGWPLALYELRHRATIWLMTPTPADAGFSAVEAARHLGRRNPPPHRPTF